LNDKFLITLLSIPGYSPPLMVCCVAGKEGRAMRKILEDFYFGNIVPYDKRMAANSELRRLVKRASDCENQLTERLNEEEQKLLNALTNAQHEINRITALENFVLGFRLGVRLMAECMDEDDGDLVDGGGN